MNCGWRGGAWGGAGLGGMVMVFLWSNAMAEEQRYKRRWRFYTTRSGASPIEEFLDALPEEDAQAVTAAMKDIKQEGNRLAHKLRGDIYEVRAHGNDRIYRILFSQEGRHENILLALEGFAKKTRKVPLQELTVAEQRLADWRSRGRQR